MTNQFELTAATEVPAAPNKAPYLDSLNDAQRQAVEATEGPVLVLAGAGTGKTRVLTTRLAHLLFTGRARAHEALAVTFTNRAAQEMKTRVEALLQRPAESLWISTFHSVGARILRQHAESAGLKPNFTILNSDDQVRLLKQLINTDNIDEKRWPARLLAAIFNDWKDRGLTPDKVAQSGANDFADGKGPGLYRKYQERLQTLNAADFGDLLLHNLNIFAENPDVLSEYQNRFRYILVDEYQDTNIAQYMWLRLLAQNHHNLCCVGDDDQSIYSWRGAEVANILGFDRDFPGARVIRLEQNYRSTPEILAAASELIAKNEGRLGKTLWTDRAKAGKVRVQGAWDAEEEARMICEEISDKQQKGLSLGEIAILVRASFQTREFEERLLTMGLPYRVIGGLRFYEHREIRDAVAYIRVACQPNDDLAFERIINVPKRGIGSATLQSLHQFARTNGISLTAAAGQLVATDELRSSARRRLRNLLEDFSRWQKQLSEVAHGELVGIMLDESGYTEMLQQDRAPDAPGRLDNLKELVAAVENFENLDAFLEHISLVMENEGDTSDDKVSLMTLHGAKGMEFSHVYLPGWEEDLFPHPRALDEGGAEALEEERRLAHVAITRARTHLTITFAASRRVYNQWRNSVPSRFIDELPPDCVEHQTPKGLYGSGRTAVDSEVFGRTNQGPRYGVTSGGLVIDGAAEHAGESSLSDYCIGERVFHQKFGYGHISAIEGNRLSIDFEKSGTKKVIDSFVIKS